MADYIKQAFDILQKKSTARVISINAEQILHVVA